MVVLTPLLALLTGALGATSAPPQWTRYRVEASDHTIGVYLTHDQSPKPLVILIHGSGCAPVMTIDADGALHDTSLFQDVVTTRAAAFHFALIEKRGVEPLTFSRGMDREQREKAFARAEQKCSAEFLRHNTKPSRVDDVIASLVALRREPWVKEIVLAGHSEGTHVATGVLRRLKEPAIAAAGLFASAGPIPLYAGYVAAGSDSTRFREIFDRIRMLQQADDDFMHHGLPARRWKTFWLDSTPIEDVRDTMVPLFVAQGSRDGSTLAADLFALEALRQQPKRSLRYVVVDGGDHGFGTAQGDRLGPLFDDFLKWTTDPARQTSVDVLR